MFSYQFLGINQERPKETLLIHQIHSNKILTITNYLKTPKNDEIKADAIVTNQKNLIIGIKTADCVPILLFCPDNDGIIAAIHAGWSGAKDNIISNAIDAMPKTGILNIQTQNLEDEVEIKIADNGTGMPKDIQRRIFEPFFTTKAVGKGTGLGLSISYGIIKKHQGSLKVHSAEGEGTIFTIRIPKVSGK